MRRYLLLIATAAVFSSVTAFVSAPAFSQGKISAYVYADYAYNVKRDSSIGSLSHAANGGEESFHEFRFRRIYLTYDNDISDQFVARFRLEADQSANTSDGKIGVAVKDAYIRWKNIFKGSDLSFGIQPPPAFVVSEDAFGYRSLEKTILDLRKIVSSRDFGLALRGKFGEKGAVRYWLMVANGNGNKPETDKYKRYYASIHVTPLADFQFTMYGDYKDAGRINDPLSGANPPATLANGTFTGAIFVGYKKQGGFSIGVETFLQSRANGYSPVPSGARQSLNALGITLFAAVDVRPDLALVGRYDYFDPNTDGLVKGDVRHYFIGAVDWKPVEDVSIMPNVIVETYETPPGGRSYDPSVTGRLTLYYTFL